MCYNSLACFYDSGRGAPHTLLCRDLDHISYDIFLFRAIITVSTVSDLFPAPISHLERIYVARRVIM
jgi:hypothetical protein